MQCNGNRNAKQKAKGLPLNLALQMTDRQFALSARRVFVFTFSVNSKPLTDDGNTTNVHIIIMIVMSGVE